MYLLLNSATSILFVALLFASERYVIQGTVRDVDIQDKIIAIKTDVLISQIQWTEQTKLYEVATREYLPITSLKPGWTIKATRRSNSNSAKVIQLLKR